MKKWKYRFKRGLASFLTVGMIAGGVSAATCFPVYAVEGEKAGVTAIEKLDDLKDAVYAGLKEQILEMFTGNAPEEKKGFTVLADFKNQGKEINGKWQEEITNGVDETLGKILQECPSEMFWYDSFNKNSNKCTGTRERDEKNDIIHAKFEFQFAVKKAYQSKDSNDGITMSVQTIRDTKNAMSDSALDKVIDESIYNGLKEEISKMVNGQDRQPNEAVFTVIVDNCNSDVTQALGMKLEKRSLEIVSRLSGQCASEFFWYNEQSEELQGQSSYYVTRAYSEAYNQGWFTFNFAVKDEYRPQDSKTNPKSLDVGKVQDTKKNIDTILDNKDMSDYAILCKYRDQLVKDYQYNPDNPNQLPQAFQWLCDQTNAFTHGTECYTITGTVDGVERMWNIVKTEGKSYLVDLVNYTQANNWGFFLAGVQTNEKGGYKVDEIVYIPKEPTGLPADLPALDSLKYRQKQSDFKIIPEPGPAGMVDTVGNPDIIIEIDGNKGDVEFLSSNPSVATIINLGNKQAQIHMVGPGETFINALAGATDNYDPRRIVFKLTVKAAGGDVVIPDNQNPGGGNTGGSGTGTGGSGTGVGGIGGGTGGSGSTGNVTTTVSSGPGELLPQIDFCLNSGSATILKSVGADDFTITASGQVKDSAVTYASSDPSVATVDANTGTVHIVGAGTATISATASATTLHREEKCEYSLEVR